MFSHELTIIALPLTTHHICEGVTQIRQFYVALKKKRKTREKNRVWFGIGSCQYSSLNSSWRETSNK